MKRLSLLLFLLPALHLMAQQELQPIDRELLQEAVLLEASPRLDKGVKNPKLHNSLIKLADSNVSIRGKVAQQHSLMVASGEVLVEVRADAAKSKNLFEGRQYRIRHNNAPGLYEVWVPVKDLRAFAADPAVGTVRPVRKPIQYAGASTTQGVAASLANTWHTAGFDGTGVTIANIDGGYSGYAARIASGDWPTAANSTYYDYDGGGFGTNGGTHGTSTVEINFDMAPGATYLMYEIATLGDWYNALVHASSTGNADIVSASLGAPLDGIGDGTAQPGSVAEACETAKNNGTLVVNAAGNEREAHWGGLFSPSSAPAFHEWNSTTGGNVNIIPFCLPNGFPIDVDLFWNDWTAVNQDYDMHLYEFNGTTWVLRASSTFTQNGGFGQTPQERVSYTVSGAFGNAFGCGPNTAVLGIAVEAVSTTSNHNLQVFSPLDINDFIEERSLGFPADSPAVMTVAAIDAVSYAQESYSSEGPVLAPGGGLGATTIAKPNITAYANVDTETDGASGFNGTSAATPHVAGAAALVLDAFPSYDGYPDALQEFLENCATDIGIAGYDTDFGAGRLTMCDGTFDAWTRDNTNDDSTEPHTMGNIWHSPDVKICQTQNCPTTQNPEFGQTNWVYVTLRNTGLGAIAPSQPAAGTLEVYFSNSGGASQWPVDWTLIDTVDVQLASNEVREIEVAWTNVPSPGHYCMLTRWVSADDPMAVPEIAQTTTNVRNNNNISWKNFNVVDLQMMVGGGNGFVMRNLEEGEQDNRLQLRVDQRFLAAGGVAGIRMDPPTLDRFFRNGKIDGLEIIDAEEGLVAMVQPEADLFLPLNPAERLPIELFFEAREPMRINGDKIDLDFEAVQLVDGQDVGGVAHRLMVRGLKTDTDGDGIPDVEDSDDDNDGVKDAADADPIDPNVGTVGCRRVVIDFERGYTTIDREPAIQVLEQKGDQMLLQLNLEAHGFDGVDVDADFGEGISGTALELSDANKSNYLVIEDQVILRDGRNVGQAVKANTSATFKSVTGLTEWRSVGKREAVAEKIFRDDSGQLYLGINRGLDADGKGVKRVVLKLIPKAPARK